MLREWIIWQAVVLAKEQERGGGQAREGGRGEGAGMIQG